MIIVSIRGEVGTEIAIPKLITQIILSIDIISITLECIPRIHIQKYSEGLHVNDLKLSLAS